MISALQNLRGFKNLLFLFFIPLLFLIVGIISIINFSGGIKINKSKLFSLMEVSEVQNTHIANLHLKFGFTRNFVANSLSFTSNTITLNAENLSVKKPFFGKSISAISLNNADVVIKSKRENNFKDNLLSFYSILPLKDSKQHILLSNVNVTIIKDDVQFVIEELNLELKKNKDAIDVKANFKIGSDVYNLTASSYQKGEFNIKIDSLNSALKVDLKENSGKVALSIHNLSKFLNEITPDNINIDLGSFSGNKNTIYFESNVVYNDVRHTVDFSNSKIQVYGNKDQEIKIETLSNNNYKVNIDLEDIKIEEYKDTTDIVVGENKMPSLQFSSLFPDLKVLFNVNIKNIDIASQKRPISISNLSLFAAFEYGKIDFNFTVLDLLNLKIKADGFFSNFESANRKGFARFEIDGSGVNLSNFTLFNVLKYNGPEKSNFKMRFDTLLSASDIFFDDIFLSLDDNLKVVDSKLQYDVYNKSGNYVVDFNVQNLNFDKVKLMLPASLKLQSQDLFKIIFQYLSFKSFNYVTFTCTSCVAGVEKFNEINLLYSLSFGKMEVEKFDFIGPNIEASLNGILDIRDPSNNISNLDIFVKKWDSFSFKKLFSLSQIFEKFEDFKVPSFINFNGVLNVEGMNVNLLQNKIEDFGMIFSLNRGILNEVSSEIILNGFQGQNFIDLKGILQGNMPDFDASLKLSGIEIQEVLKFLLKKDDFEDVKGISSLGFAVKTRGHLLSDLIKNSSSIIDLKSNLLKIDNFNVDALAKVLLSENASFKSISNSAIQSNIKSEGSFNFNALIKTNGLNAEIEKLDLKSKESAGIFIGKYIYAEPPKFQLTGKVATAGANLNTGLKGVMPIYFTSTITSENNNIGVGIDYSQINKYSEARRVLYK